MGQRTSKQPAQNNDMAFLVLICPSVVGLVKTALKILRRNLFPVPFTLLKQHLEPRVCAQAGPFRQNVDENRQNLVLFNLFLQELKGSVLIAQSCIDQGNRVLVKLTLFCLLLQLMKDFFGFGSLTCHSIGVAKERSSCSFVDSVRTPLLSFRDGLLISSFCQI